MNRANCEMIMFMAPAAQFQLSIILAIIHQGMYIGSEQPSLSKSVNMHVTPFIGRRLFKYLRFVYHFQNQTKHT